MLPVHNGSATIGEQLAGLAAQTYDGDWELLVIEDGCGDDTVDVVEGWRDRLPGLRIVPVERPRGLNRARNLGAEAARGDFLAYCDADDVVSEGWLAALVSASPQADLIGGRVEWEVLNDGRHPAWETFEPMDSLRLAYGFLPVAPGGNCGVWSDVARVVRWDESFTFAASDIEFSWRVHLAGYTLAFAPDAVLHLRLRTTLRGLARQYFRYGLGEPLLYRRFRSLDMPGIERRETIATLRWLYGQRHLLREEATRGRWVRIAAHTGGRICGSVRHGVIFV